MGYRRQNAEAFGKAGDLRIIIDDAHRIHLIEGDESDV
jgi:hypothetical protein